MLYLNLSVLIIQSIELYTLYNPLVTYLSVFIIILKVFSFLIDFLIFL